MADNWDDLEKEFAAPGQWRPTGKEAEGPSWDSLEKHVKKQVEVQTTFPQVEEPAEVDPKTFEGSTLKFGPVDTKIPLPNGVAMGLAQLGSGMSNVGLGYNQMVGKATKQDAAEKRKMDAPLTKGILGTINSMSGEVLPTLAVPSGWGQQLSTKAGPLLEGLLMGGAQGALAPVAPGESRGTNVALGGTAGTIFPGLLATAKGLSKPPAGNQALVAAAEKEGIPLGVADTTSSKLIKAFRSFANDLPFTGSSNEAVRESQIEAFNKAVGGRYGSSATKHTAGQREIDKKNITDVMDDVWGRNNLPYDANLFGALRKMEADSVKYPGKPRDTVLAHIKDLESKVVQDPKGNLYIPGTAAKEFQTDLFKNYGNKKEPTALDNQMMDLRGSILDNFNASVTGPDAARLTKARQQYRAFKAVEPALKKADVGVAQREVGDVRPIDLSAGVLQQYKRNPSESPFGDLPQIGQRFLRDTTSQTGGSIRAMLQNTGLAGSALMGMGWLTNPMLAAGTSLGFAGANKAMSSPAMRRYLQNGPTGVQRLMLDKPDAARAGMEALEGAFQRAPAVGALGMVPRRAVSDDETENP
jgi:hypothetical protein